MCSYRTFSNPLKSKFQRPSTGYNILKSVISLAFLILSIACQSHPPVHLPDHFLKKKLPPAFFLETLIKRQSYLRDLKSFVDTTVTRNEKTQSLKQVFLIQGYQRIRIETLSPFGNPLGIFIHSGRSTIFYDMKNNKRYENNEVRKILNNFLGTPIGIEEALYLFSGTIPGLNTLSMESVRLDPDRKYYILNTADLTSGTQYLIRLDAYNLVPVSLIKQKSKKTVYRVEWKRYQKIGNYFFPHHASLILPDLQETLDIEYQKPKINSGILASSFQLK